MCVLENADILVKEKNDGLPATANEQKKHFDLFTLWRRTVLKNKTKVILIFTRTRPGIQTHMYGVRVSSCRGRQMKIPVSTYVVIYINHWAERFTKLGICRSCLLHYLSISYVHMCIWFARRYVRYKLMISREAFRSFYKFKKKKWHYSSPIVAQTLFIIISFRPSLSVSVRTVSLRDYFSIFFSLVVIQPAGPIETKTLRTITFTRPTMVQTRSDLYTQSYILFAVWLSTFIRRGIGTTDIKM